MSWPFVKETQKKEGGYTGFQELAVVTYYGALTRSAIKEEARKHINGNTSLNKYSYKKVTKVSATSGLVQDGRPPPRMTAHLDWYPKDDLSDLSLFKNMLWEGPNPFPDGPVCYRFECLVSKN